MSIISDATPAQSLAATLVAWLAQRLGARDATAAPFLLGVSGLQGGGKSTLATQLVEHASVRGIDAVTLSLDDVYRTRAERAALAQTVHPLLATRGVPGTHDVALLHATLDALASASRHHPATIPRFDKGIDDRVDPATWQHVEQPPRVVVLEGWCIGVPPQADADLATPINALERDEDPHGQWRHHVNAALAGDYAALWSRLDALAVLQAPSFDVVRGWRDEQETALRSAGASHAMTPGQVARFVAHYERISRHALATLPQRADVLVSLDVTRRAESVRVAETHQ